VAVRESRSLPRDFCRGKKDLSIGSVKGLYGARTAHWAPRPLPSALVQEAPCLLSLLSAACHIRHEPPCIESWLPRQQADLVKQAFQCKLYSLKAHNLRHNRALLKWIKMPCTSKKRPPAPAHVQCRRRSTVCVDVDTLANCKPNFKITHIFEETLGKTGSFPLLIAVPVQRQTSRPRKGGVWVGGWKRATKSLRPSSGQTTYHCVEPLSTQQLNSGSGVLCCLVSALPKIEGTTRRRGSVAVWQEACETAALLCHFEIYHPSALWPQLLWTRIYSTTLDRLSLATTSSSLSPFIPYYQHGRPAAIVRRV
jgi:hypothetical protein